MGLEEVQGEGQETRTSRHLDEWKFTSDLERKEGETGLERKMSSVWDSDFKVPVAQEVLVGIWSCQVFNLWQ